MGVIIAVAICIYYSQPSSQYISSWEGKGGSKSSYFSILLWGALSGGADLTLLVVMNFLFKNIPCGLSMMDCPETSGNLLKPAAEVSGGFPNFSKKYLLIEKSGNLPETSAAGFLEVSSGFQRFPDNP